MDNVILHIAYGVRYLLYLAYRKNHKILIISMSNTNIWTSDNHQAMHCEDFFVLRQLFLSHFFFGQLELIV